jgi:hypothetical protein
MSRKSLLFSIIFLLLLQNAHAGDGLDGELCDDNDDCLSECVYNEVVNRLCQPKFENETHVASRWECESVRYYCNHLAGEECIESSDGPECVDTGKTVEIEQDPELACPSKTFHDDYEATPVRLILELKKQVDGSGNCKAATVKYVETGEQTSGAYSPYSKWRYDNTYVCSNPKGIEPLSNAPNLVTIDITHKEKSVGDYPDEGEVSWQVNFSGVCSSLNDQNIVINYCDPNVSLDYWMPRATITVDCDDYSEDPNDIWGCVDAEDENSGAYCAKIGERNPPEHEGDCEITDVKGEFQPSQGVWQDDKNFDLFFRIYSDTSYRARLDMVKGRPTLLYGNYHNNEVHEKIVIRGNTTYTEDEVATVRFTMKQPGIKQVIHEETMTLPIAGECGDKREFSVEVYAENGIPAYDPFYFNKTGPYILDAAVFDSENESVGIRVAVFGEVVETHAPRVRFDYLIVKEKDGAMLENQTKRIMQQSAKIQDYYPIPKDNMTFQLGRFHNFSTLTSGDVIELLTDLDDKLTKRAILGNADRLVVIISDEEMKGLKGSSTTAGFAMNHKVVFVRASEDHHSVAHEIAHTLPYLWSGDQMNESCRLNYHNKVMTIANGPNPFTGVIREGSHPFMGGTKYDIWTTQCTYRNLLEELQTPPDPEVIFVTGKVSRDGTDGELSTIYQIESIVDEQAEGNWSVVLRDGNGVELGRHNFTMVWEIEHLDITLDERSFFIRMPYTYGVHSIELIGPGGVLDSKTFNSEPYVDIWYPENNSTVPAGSVKLNWSGGDWDEDKLLYTVLYSTDGELWIDHALETESTELRIPLANVTDHYVKVIVTDGTQSDDFVVQFKSSTLLKPDEEIADEVTYGLEGEDGICCLPALFLVFALGAVFLKVS